MRISIPLFLLLLMLGFYAGVHLKLNAGATQLTRSNSEKPGAALIRPSQTAIQNSELATPTVPLSLKVDFDTQIRPILEARCQPCHFNGGKVYQRLPFDRPETIRTLGTKLFTRLKDENERRLIRQFLEQQ
jgi:hypothetical protein